MRVVVRVLFARDGAATLSVRSVNNLCMCVMRVYVCVSMCARECDALGTVPYVG